MDEATMVALVAARVAVGEDGAEELYDLLEPLAGKTRARALVDSVMGLVGREEHAGRVNEQRRRRGGKTGPTQEDFDALRQRLLEMERASRANEAIIAQFRAEQEKKREAEREEEEEKKKKK